jgi:hypothetical protein
MESSCGEERTGVLVVRVWDEPGAVEPLRGRVSACLDIKGRRMEELAVHSAQEIESFVRQWLSRFVRASSPD